jgi:hypothetical protein
MCRVNEQSLAFFRSLHEPSSSTPLPGSHVYVASLPHTHRHTNERKTVHPGVCIEFHHHDLGKAQKGFPSRRREGLPWKT